MEFLITFRFISRFTYFSTLFLLFLLISSLTAAEAYDPLQDETRDHLFLHCDFTWEIWSLLRWQLGTAFGNSRQLEEVLNDIRAQKAKGGKEYKRLRILFGVVVWHVWRERNCRIFEGRPRTVIAVKRIIEADIDILDLR